MVKPIFCLLICASFCHLAAAQDTYHSYRVRIYPYSRDPGVVTRGDWNSQPVDTTLSLRLVTAGRITLYAFQDTSGEPYFFIQREGGQPEALRIRNRVVRRGAATDVVTEEDYRQQLTALVARCPKAADNVASIIYEENALKMLIDAYNNCGVEEAKGRVSLRFYLEAGLVHSTVRPGGSGDAAHASWPAYNGPTGGLGMLVQPTRGRLRRFGVYIDGLFDQFSLHSNKYQKNYYQAYQGKMMFDEIKANVQIRYLLPAGKFRPFVGLGFSNSFIINNKSTQTIFDAGSSATIRQDLFGSDANMRQYRPGAFAALGVFWKRWSLELRYEQTADLLGITSMTAPVSNGYVFAGFRL